MIDENKLITELEKLKQEVNMPSDIVWNNLLKVCIDTVNEQPKVGDWIPCSERLPEEETEVFVTRDFLGANQIQKCRYVETAEHIGGSWYSISDEYKCYRSKHTNPIAWMPLPKAYKEEVN